jgi:hypothetical protein
MKHAIWLVMVIILVANLWLTAQKTHEIKTDLMSPFLGIGHLAWEYAPLKRWSVELGFWGNHQEQAGYWNSNSDVGYFEDINIGIFTLSGRYYLMDKQASGPFMGFYWREDWRFSRINQDYEDATVAAYRLYSTSKEFPRNLRQAIGPQLGWKFLFKKHYLLELSMGFDWSVQYPEKLIELSFGLPGVKFGYRL